MGLLQGKACVISMRNVHAFYVTIVQLERTGLTNDRRAAYAQYRCRHRLLVLYS